MPKPLFSYRPGTMLGMVQVLQGAYTEKLVMFKATNPETGEEFWMRAKKHIYGKTTWFWTGYRWVPVDGNEATESRRDARRWELGMRLNKNGEWERPVNEHPATR